MRPLLLLLSLAALGAGGCFRAHDDRPADGADLGSAVDAGPSIDAFVCLPDLGPPSPEIWLTQAEAECIGLTAPRCASCHVRPDGWVLRPMDAPPPPGATVPLRPVEECVPPCRLE